MDQLQPPPIKPRPQSKSEQLPTAADQGQRNMPTVEAEDRLYAEIADDTTITTTSNEVVMDQLQPPPIKPQLRSKSEQLPIAVDQSQSNMPTGEAEDSFYIEIDDDISIATTSKEVTYYFARETALKLNATPMQKQRTRRSAGQWLSVLKSSLRLY
jgi:hypothetical protein